jgi:F0F1-type ATP synthase gamma subunit
VQRKILLHAEIIVLQTLNQTTNPCIIFYNKFKRKMVKEKTSKSIPKSPT